MNSSKPRLLVVGGNGFIGRHIVRNALDLNWIVTSLNTSIPVNEDRFRDVSYLAANVSDRHELSRALVDPSFEYVVNCGGYINHAPLLKGGDKVFETHFCGAFNLARILNRDALKAFVNIGSSDEYGSIPAPQMEISREQPISPYSMGKVAATHFLEMLYRTEDFPATTLRLFLTYGPGQDTSRFLPQIIKGCIENRSFPTSAGLQVRDFCFIRDTVAAVFATLMQPLARGQIINIGSGSGVPIRQVIELIQTCIKGGNPFYGEIPYRRGENMALYADVAKAKLILGWSAKTSLEEGLLQTIEWVRGAT